MTPSQYMTLRSHAHAAFLTADPEMADASLRSWDHEFQRALAAFLTPASCSDERESVRRRLAGDGAFFWSSLGMLDLPPVKTKSAMQSVLDRTLASLELTVRTSNCLRAAGLWHVRDVAVMSHNQLLGIENFGAKCFDELNRELMKLGFNSKDKRQGK